MCAATRSTMASLNRRQVLRCLAMTGVAVGPWPSEARAPSGFPLWEVSSGGHRVYLLGHTPPRKADWSDGRVESLLEGCGVLWKETSETPPPNIQQLIQHYGTDPDSLMTRLDGSQQRRLEAAAKAVAVPEESLTHFRPWLAGQTLEGAFYSAKGFTGQNADKVLTKEAQKLGIPVSSEFPSVEDAARWFSELSPDAELQYLLYVLDEILVGHDEGQRTYARWAVGDDTPALAWVTRMRRLYTQLYEAIVAARNRRWVPRVQDMLSRDKPSMVVVGLYHLAGPDKIQKQLAAHGLAVRLIDLSRS